MGKYIDLHLHTTASDGTDRPQELVAKAAKLDFSAIAITDHDTVAGLDEAIEAGSKYGVEVIAGIELNTDYGDTEIHILGYFIDYSSEILINKLASLKEARYNRIKEIIQKLREIDIDIDFTQVQKIAGDAPLGRAHLAQAIIEQGYESNWSKVFDKYIGRNSPAYVRRKKLSPEDAIKLVKKVGGVPIVAHPVQIGNDQLLADLIKWGIKGIEAYHSDHSEEDTVRYLNLAQANDLLVTGGSDCHGKKRKEGELMGQIKAPYSLLDRLKAAKK